MSSATRGLTLPRIRPARLLETAVVTAAAAVVALAAAVSNGNVLVPVALVAAVAGGFLMLVRPAVCFAGYVFAAMLFEQFQIFGLDAPVTLQVPFFLNLNSSAGIPGGVINPVEILLATMALSWALQVIVTRQVRWQPVPHLWAVLLFMGVLVGGLGFGLAKHGDFKVALWEIRALFYWCLTYLIGSQIIRTRGEIVMVVWALLLGIAIKGLQGMWRYFVDLGGSLGDIEAITGHEDAVFMVTVFLFAAALFMFRGPRSMVIFSAVTFPTTFLTFLFAQRRVAYGALGMSLLILFVYLPRAQKLWFLSRVCLPALPFLAVYTGAFWNSSSSLAMPIRQVQSIFADGEEDRSNLYRDIEKINLQETIRAFPAGVGFGKKYLIVIPLDEVDFPLWEYIPHNCILWLWTKLGLAGFWAFWIFVALLVTQATVDFRYTADPLFRSLQVTAVVFVIIQCVVSYYDLQLTFYRNMMYLGALLALLVPIRILSGAERAQRADAGAPACP